MKGGCEVGTDDLYECVRLHVKIAAKNRWRQQKVYYVHLELSRVVKRWAINLRKSEGNDQNEDDEKQEEEEVEINEIGKLNVECVCVCMQERKVEKQTDIKWYYI